MGLYLDEEHHMGPAILRYARERDLVSNGMTEETALIRKVEGSSGDGTDTKYLSQLLMPTVYLDHIQG